MNAIEASMNLCDDFYCTDGLPINKSPLFKGSLKREGIPRLTLTMQDTKIATLVLKQH